MGSRPPGEYEQTRASLSSHGGVGVFQEPDNLVVQLVNGLAVIVERHAKNQAFCAGSVAGEGSVGATGSGGGGGGVAEAGSTSAFTSGGAALDGCA